MTLETIASWEVAWCDPGGVIRDRTMQIEAGVNKHGQAFVGLIISGHGGPAIDVRDADELAEIITKAAVRAREILAAESAP